MALLSQPVGNTGGNSYLYKVDENAKENVCNSPKRKYRIRKLTPRECWRLMGFKDEDFDKAERYNSDTQLYKQAGNSIVVDCMCSFLSVLFKKKQRAESREQRAEIDYLICEHRRDEGLRFFNDNVCGTLRTIDSCGDKRVIQLN